MNSNYEIRELSGEPMELLYSCGLLQSGIYDFDKDAVTLGTLHEDNVVGCVVYTFFKKGKTTSLKNIHVYPGDGVFIERLCVSGEYRKNGLGKELLDACKRDARINSMKNNFVFACPVDVDATGFFERCGMQLKIGKIGEDTDVIYSIQYMAGEEPEFFLEKGDIGERKRYWQKRLKV